MSNFFPDNPKRQAPLSTSEVQKWVAEGKLAPTAEAERARQKYVAGALLLSTVVGIVSGVVGIALSVLATTILGTGESNFAGMEIAAVIFVVFGVLGWVTSATLLWYRLRSSSKTGQT